MYVSKVFVDCMYVYNVFMSIRMQCNVLYVYMQCTIYMYVMHLCVYVPMYDVRMHVL